MRITDVRTYIPMVGIRPQCLVRISTDAGIVGWGESGLSAREEAVAAAVGHYRDLLIGADPMARGAIWQRLYRSQYFEGGRVLPPPSRRSTSRCTTSAARRSVSRCTSCLVGSNATSCRCSRLPAHRWDRPSSTTSVASSTKAGRRSGSSRACPARAAHPTAQAHHPPSRTRPPMAPRPRIRTSSSLARRSPSPLNGRPAFARRSGPGSRSGSTGITGCRSPRRPAIASACRPQLSTSWRSRSAQRAPTPTPSSGLLTDVPFAIGEEFSSKWSFLPFIERGLTDFVRVDVCNVGGFTEAMKVAGWAEAHYLDLMPHNPLGPICTAATGHLCTAVPNVSWMEIRRSATEDLGFYDRDLFPVQVTLDGPRLILSDAPGLGVEVDESRLEAVVAGHWHPQQLHRRDGSVQNW